MSGLRPFQLPPQTGAADPSVAIHFIALVMSPVANPPRRRETRSIQHIRHPLTQPGDFRRTQSSIRPGKCRRPHAPHHPKRVLFPYGRAEMS